VIKLPLKSTKPFFFALAILLGLPNTQSSCSELDQTMHPPYFSQQLLEIKMGYLFFSNSPMRRVYDKGGLDVQLCGAYPIWQITNRWSLNAYSAIEYCYLSGQSISNHQKTFLWSVPFSLGLKAAYAILPDIQYYATIGPRYFYIHQHNNSPYVDKNQSSNELGFFINTGFNCLVSDHFIIDIFGEYSCAKAHIESKKSDVYPTNAQIGAFIVGGGLGYKF